ncbi:dihydroxyacetone kinase-like protein [Mycoplasma testudineum]|uniref:Dihydroxyacetone kinase-like protein n=1 Tax=Mycoplasma testudineum TaxID=244584 RepID=A0A4R6ICA2_9MOLU|nr:dihydroxyacetone kinase subunit DhaL [Mycoplasma testudineum]OYD26628.1 dihydroxyacetone kinase subunit L [Mycoplasma testudineum]TDO19464.1 dihydroxyacetone kinase-like protein [Mycoplasma testudineum]
MNWKKVFIEIADEIISQKDYLTDLDIAIGDSDHGINMERGFSNVKVAIENIDETNVQEILKSVGMILLSKVGGASGPLYGMSFREASVKVDNSMSKEEIIETIAASFVYTIKRLGKSQLGDKTMMDVWENFANFYATEKDKAKNIKKLNGFVDSTKDMEAKKGRASFLGKRSIGTIDPGSASSKIIIMGLLNI